jgi:hypothetical protein
MVMKERLDLIIMQNGASMTISLFINFFINICLFISFITGNKGPENGFLIVGFLLTGFISFLNYKAVRNAMEIKRILESEGIIK